MVDLGKAERVEFPENFNASDLEGFQNQSDGDRFDLQDQMNGDSNRHQDGGRHDLNPRGLSSENYAVQQQQVIEQQQFNQIDEQMFVPQQQTNGQDWKRLYGQSENEKGELRRLTQQLSDRLQQLETQQQQQQLFASQPPPPQFYGAPNANVYQQPQIQQQPVYQQAPQVDWSRMPSLIKKGDDEMLLASDVDRAIKEHVAPYVEAVAWQAQQAQQQALAAQAQFFNAQKSQMGLTPQVEVQVLAQKPWLRNIQDPSAYLGAMQQELALMHAQQQAAQQTQARQLVPQQQTPQVTQDLRRRTFVERGSGNGQEPQQAVNAEAIWQAEWAKTLTLPHGDPRRTQRQKALLDMRGVNSVTGYRDPNILTR